jgi:hypothetical protein
MKAWLVTWEWSGDRAKRYNKVAAIFNPRFGEDRVRQLVEFIYLSAEYSLSERMGFAKDPKHNPYPAEFGSLDGVPWRGEINCGHNPYLFARLVDDLTVEADAHGNEKPSWKERGYPKGKRTDPPTHKELVDRLSERSR